jgi:hypothetical protein
METKDWLGVATPTIVSPELLDVAHQIKDTFEIARQLYGEETTEAVRYSVSYPNPNPNTTPNSKL